MRNLLRPHTERAYRLRFVLLVVLASSPFLALSALGLARAHADEQARVVADRAALARSIAHTIDTAMGGHFALLRGLALMPTIADPARHADAQAALRRQQEAYPAFEGIGLYDSAGADIAHTSQEAFSFNIADRDYFPYVLDTDEPVAGRLVLGRGTGVLTVPLAVPVSFDDGTRGALVAPLALGYLDAELSGLTAGSGVQAVLVDREGRVFIDPDPVVAKQLLSRRGRADVEAVLGGGSGAVQLDAAGTPILSAYAPVPTTGWGLLLTQPTADAFRQADLHLLRGAALLLSVLLATLALGWLLGGRLARAYAEEQRMRAASDAQRRFLEHLIATAPLAVAVLEGPSHRYAMVNARYQALCPGATLTGRPFAEVWPASVRAAVLPVLDAVYRSGQPHTAIDAPLALPAADGATEERYFSGVLSRHEGMAGGPPGVLVVLLETTASVQARTRAVREKDEFLSLASHELRTPLTTISMAAQVQRRALRKEALDAALLERQARTIEQQVRRSSQLVGELLDVAHIQSGYFEVRPAPVDLGALAYEAVLRQRDALGDAGAGEIILNVEDAPLVVLGDESRLDQMLTNLLSNAVKYSYAGGSVLVTVASAGDSVRLAVIDHGIGVPPGERGALFAPFRRTSIAREHGVEGTGLGLYITQRLVTAQGGTIAVEDTPGGGTTFVVTFPAAARDAEAQAPSAPAATG
ncbi:MAG TPA: ATP-binding protein [Chloroflexota bacterium]|nr:ATP-binding protein [Chloroflexota bacterium]